MIGYLKIGAAIAVGAALFFGVRWISSTIEKARERDEFEARAIAAEKASADLSRTYLRAQERDVEIQTEIRDFRAEEAARGKELRDAIRAKPITREVPREANPDGTCPPARERDPVRYRELFNEAVGPAYP